MYHPTTYKQNASRHHLQKDNGGSGSTVLAYKPIILSVSTYSSFGAPLEDGSTNWSNESYRYGFNGMEKDDEMKGTGNSYTTEFRILEPRLGRWLSIDPLAYLFSWQSPMVSLDNNPILLIDPKGLNTIAKGKNLAADAGVSDNTASDNNGSNFDVINGALENSNSATSIDESNCEMFD